MKTLFISNGTNDAQTTTKASAENGYLRVAAKLCGTSISHGLQRLKIKVRDEDGTEVFSQTRDINA